MEIINFLKTLNKKIDSYDKMVPKTNPFLTPNHITIVWIEKEPILNRKFEN